MVTITGKHEQRFPNWAKGPTFLIFYIRTYSIINMTSKFIFLNRSSVAASNRRPLQCLCNCLETRAINSEIRPQRTSAIQQGTYLTNKIRFCKDQQENHYILIIITVFIILFEGYRGAAKRSGAVHTFTAIFKRPDL